MSVYNEYGRSAIERLLQEYNKARIEGFIAGAEQDINQIREYIHACKNRLQVLEAAEYKREITVSKGKSYAGAVEYRIVMSVIPMIGDHEHRGGAWSDLVDQYPATPDPHDIGALPGRHVVLLRSTHLRDRHGAKRIIRFPVTQKEIQEHDIREEELKA